MAFNVSYNFIAKDAFSRVSRGINASVIKSKRLFKALGNQFKKTGDKFRRTSKQIKSDTASIGSGLKKLFIGGALFLGFRKLITVGSDFQDTLLGLSAITGATGDDLDMLQVKTFELAKASSTSAADILTAFKLVGSAKAELLKNLPALIETTRQVLILKNASGIELASAAEITAESLNIFGKSAKSANEFVNILAAGSKLGSSEIGDTGAAIILAGNNARAGGLSFLELNAAIQAVARSGIKGSQAGTALSAIFGRLRRGDKAKGIEGLDIGKLGLVKTFTLIKNALDSITDSTTRARLEAAIFGEEHAKTALGLLNNIDALRELLAGLKGTTIAQQQAELRLTSFNAKMRRLGATINEVLIKIFLKLEPAILRLTGKFSDFIKAITPEQINTFVATLSAAIDTSIQLIVIAIKNLKELLKNVDFSAFSTTNIDNVIKSVNSLAKSLDNTLAPARFLASIFKGIGTGIGEGIAEIVTLNFRQGTTIKEAFSIDDRLFGIGKKSVSPVAPVPPILLVPPVVPKAPISALGISAQANVNVNLSAPRNTIDSVQTQITGDRRAMNLGTNLVTA